MNLFFNLLKIIFIIIAIVGIVFGFLQWRKKSKKQIKNSFDLQDN